MSSADHRKELKPEAVSGHIGWLLAHPGVSEWLKAALRSAESCDPVALINDLELLRFVLGRRADEQVSRLHAAKNEIDVADGPGRGTGKI